MLRLLPEIARDKDFALHGGTAINLFYYDMPRLSVDVDLTFIPFGDRKKDIKCIRLKLLELSACIKRSLPHVAIKEPVSEEDELKLYCTFEGSLVKIEVNTINRGVFGDVKILPLSNMAQKEFKSYCEMQIVPIAQLLGGKIVAALDRQHPRDLFDVRKILASPGYSDDIHKGFMFCLLSSKRPFHEILKPGDVNQMAVMESQFSGMTDEDFSYNTYENVKRKLLKKVIAHLSEHDKALLTSFTSGDPVWPEKDLSCFPGIRWKLLNIRKLKTSNKIKYQHQLDQLAQILDYTGKQ